MQRQAMTPMTGTQVFFRLASECLRHRSRFVIGVGALLTVALARLYLTWLVKLWAEGPLLSGDNQQVRWLILVGALSTVVIVTAVFVARYLLMDVNQRMLQRLRDAAQQKLLAMPPKVVRQFPSGDLFSRVFNDVGGLSPFVGNVFKRVISEGIVAIGAITIMFYLDWRLALATCVMLPLVALIFSQVAGAIRRWSALAQRGLGELSATFAEQLGGLTTIKGFQAEHFESDRFARQNTSYRRQFMRAEWWSGMLISAVWLITGIGFLGVLWYGTEQVTSGRMTAGALLAFCLYAGQAIDPLRRLSDVHGLLQRVIATAIRVFEITDSPAAESEGAMSLSRPVRGDLRLEDLRFWYRRDEPVLEGVNLRIVPGETVGIVAASGRGKSTLARLLVRFLDPQEGRIVLDGLDLSAIRLTDVRRAVCIVEQEPFIFSGTLADNIRYGSWEASVRVIESAAARAGLDTLVASLPDGFEAHMKEGGGNLSGGQKQRIALARSIVRDPAILVLDEATSALDSDMEGQIFARLEEWLAQRTVVVMAHRLSTVSRLPRVCVLDGGRVVGDGNVSQLIEYCAPFRRLFGEQLEPLGTRPRIAAAGR